jgi:hypothetical protein
MMMKSRSSLFVVRQGSFLIDKDTIIPYIPSQRNGRKDIYHMSSSLPHHHFVERKCSRSLLPTLRSTSDCAESIIIHFRPWMCLSLRDWTVGESTTTTVNVQNFAIILSTYKLELIIKARGP